MLAFQVQNSTFIAASVNQVYNSIRDFRQWPSWSPWIITDPKSRLEYSADGMGYTWKGRITGSGEMTVTRDDAPRSIDYQLTFLKPWKSTTITRFALAEKDGGTELTWTMEGSLPLVMFWAKAMISAHVGGDFHRGLMLLKDYIEIGRARCHLAFPGPRSFPGCHYAGVRACCPVADLSANLQRDIKLLKAWLDTTGTKPTGGPFNICHKWDQVECTTEYTICLPVESAPAAPPAGVVTGKIPACQTYVIRHTGPYRYLGNARAAGDMRSRMRVFAPNSKIDSFEIYENDPAVVSENELVTLLHFPMK